jgi:eukaryotic-like serine/threonine-protein kinase
MISLVGQTLSSWRLEGLIAEGGMGRVYRAVHTGDGRQGALKLLSYDFDDENDALSRFYHEARAMASILSPHLVTIYEYVREGPLAAYVMEYLEGEDLGRVLVRERQFAPPRAVRIAMQVCEGMQAVHDGGVVHRDLKPENVFLVRDAPAPDYVKILDFGIAKYFQSVGHRTARGAMVGSPWYMSPEQAKGLAQVDGRSDLYSLGVILYEMLSGQVPFEGQKNSEVAKKHIHDVPAPLGGDYGSGPVSPELAGVVLRCLAKEPDHRFPSMKDLRGQLAALPVSG